MKKQISAFAIMMAAFGSANAQSKTATGLAAANATVVTAYEVKKDKDLDFGSFSVSLTAGGTVIIAPNSDRDKSGGVNLLGTTKQAAEFTLYGAGNDSYTVTLPTSVDLKLEGGTETMSATNFTSDAGLTPSLTAGTGTLKVGATLNVLAAQKAGTYKSDNFEVTVNFN